MFQRVSCEAYHFLGCCSMHSISLLAVVVLIGLLMVTNHSSPVQIFRCHDLSGAPKKEGVVIPFWIGLPSGGPAAAQPWHCCRAVPSSHRRGTRELPAVTKSSVR